MMDNKLKTRFCPSPTGLMHIGNLRTGLFNVLLAHSLAAKGEPCDFVLRVEDSDPVRSKHLFTESIYRDLHWMACDWQEGPEKENGNGPYFQSQRHEIYEKYYQQLLDNNQAYWCYCTETELSIVRRNQINAHQPPRYAGTCRHLTPEQRAAKEAKGLKPALRFRIPDNETVTFTDFIQGPKSFQTSDIGDFIIKKMDGSSSFMFCNAVDDALMGITHAMRGEDHLTNSPRQILILQALGLTPPQYGHMPLILGFDGKPLSKRNGSQAIESLRNEGYFAIALANYLSRLGHHYPEEKLMPMTALGENFDVAHISRSPAHFDEVQLKHWQKEAVLQLTVEAFWEWIEPHVKHLVSPEMSQAFCECIMQNVIFPQDAVSWAQQLLTDQFTMDPDAKALVTEMGEERLHAIQSAIQEHGEDYAQIQKTLKEKTDLKGKALFMGLRSVLTGRTYGPELGKIIPLMGKQLLLYRIEWILHAAKGF